MFCEKVVRKNISKFTGKHLCQNLFFNKVASLRPAACTFIKKETLAQVFSYEFCEISKNTFSYRTPLGGCFRRSSPFLTKIDSYRSNSPKIYKNKTMKISYFFIQLLYTWLHLTNNNIPLPYL